MNSTIPDPLAALLANTDSRYWRVRLVPVDPVPSAATEYSLPADWSKGQLIHPQDQVVLVDYLRPLLAGNENQLSCEYRARNEENEWRWYRLRGQLEPAQHGEPPVLHLWASEITRQKRAEQLLALQSRIVQQLASGESLSRVLEELALGVESNYIGAAVSILAVSPDKQTLQHLAAPSLPEHVRNEIDGVSIGPMVGACGAAAALGERVIIPDVTNDPRMHGFEVFSRETGIRAVWSQPIVGEQGEVIGTLAIYRMQVHTPSSEELELIMIAANLAALAIENRKRIDQLLRSEERFRELAEKARLVPWEAELGDDRYIYVGPQATDIFGYPVEKWLEPKFWYSVVDPDEARQLWERFEEFLASGGEHFETEYRFRAADGRTIWVHDYVSVFRRPGKPTRLRGYLVDVTRRKLAEQAQRESDALLTAVMLSLPFRLWAADHDGKIILQNPVSVAQFGNVVGKRVPEITLPPQIAAQHDSFVQRALAGEVVKAEIAHNFLGSPRVDQCILAPIRLENSIIGVLGCDIDITAQREVEERLRKSENQLSTLLQFAPDLILQVRRDTTIIYCNRIPPPTIMEQVVGSKCLDWIAPDYRSTVEEAFNTVFTTGQPVNYEAPSASATSPVRWWSIHLAPIIDGGKIESCIMIARDITRRREMQQAIQDQVERFTQLAEATDQGFWLIELNPEKLLYVNPAFARIWGRKLEEFYEGVRVGEQYIVPEDRERVHQQFDNWLAGREASYNVEYRIGRPDGQLRWVHDIGAKIFNSKGELYRASGIVRDVTEQKRAEVILRESEERYRLLAENSSDLIMRVNRAGECLYASPASRLLLGIDPLQIKSILLFQDLVHPDDAQRLAAVREAFTWTGKPVSVTARFRHANGEYRALDLQAKAVLDPISGDTTDADGAPLEARELLITARDATDRIDAARKLRQREVDLAHADRMSTMGQMAAELAHELNQPLYAIANFATVCRGALATAGENSTQAIEQARHWLDEISKQSRRAADVIRRINSFVRKGEIDPTTFDLSECVKALEPLLEVASRGHEATIRYELATSLPPITADRLLIEQVIVNLVRNAAEALEEVPVDDRQIEIRTYREGNGVGLSVADNGPGLQPELIERLFEPYFTTKEGGTGMGLPICRSTLEAHHGRISVVENPTPNSLGGHGVIFRIWLPVSD
jgi:PAS domain S-box-containing protein